MRGLLCSVSLLIKLFVDIPMMLIGLLVVPFGIKYGFTGWLWPWGNDDHPDNGGDFARRNGISPYSWFALRNPTFNFSKFKLGLVATGSYTYTGVPDLDAQGESRIGDKKGGGWSWVRMGWAWEFYYIKPYSDLDLKTWTRVRKCIRIRAGWKLYGKPKGERCQFVFVPNPLMSYSGV